MAGASAAFQHGELMAVRKKARCEMPAHKATRSCHENSHAFRAGWFECLSQAPSVARHGAMSSPAPPGATRNLLSRHPQSTCCQSARTVLGGWAMKRLFDIAASLFGLIALGWLIGLLAVLIRRESEGPGIFRQERVGRHGRTFVCYKMRTMARETPNAASHETSASFVTPFGARLRRYKLDELPQLWNVLRGEMSLVGPRPCLPVQTQLIAARMAEGALTVRPGITGPAQVRGIDMSEPERLARIDGAYARERSFFGDLRLILQTLAGGGQGDRVKLEAGPPTADSAAPDTADAREPGGSTERVR